MDTLYDRLGGEGALVLAVHNFYGKVVADPLLAPFFENLDLGSQTQKMIAFMTWAFDGPAEQRGRSLGEAHAHLVTNKGLADQHFDCVADHLSTTLRELDVQEEAINEVLSVVATTREAVLSGDPSR
ncbi:MAG: group 1 truncated hemoglobin [Gammaproteobacteria bacterium]|nr:group 1 truncated hemoglobin [Gammaproteobacteria bacterium]